ncbi:MAG: hypothetical protein ACW99J_20490 [Candidatus Thorarchaeota archaeon]|jgi:hypothetical protein
MESVRDDSDNRGDLLFDETKMESFKRSRKARLLWSLLFLSLLALFVALFLGSLISVGWPGIVASTMGILGSSYVFHLHWSSWKSLYPTKVYENGIAFGWRPKNLREKGEDDYIPFERFEEVYFNGFLSYKLKEERPKRELKFEVPFDLEAFYSSLVGRVRIESNAHISPEGQVVWESPDDVSIKDLGFELRWGSRRKEIMFDDMTDLVIRGTFALVTPRDGEEFAIKLSKEDLRRLARAWIAYQERYWEDPEAEEERWERLEADE